MVSYQTINCTTTILAAVLKHRRIDLHWLRGQKSEAISEP